MSANTTSNDLLACQVDWGDSAVADGAVTHGACTASHAYPTKGKFTITGAVTDDNGGSGCDTANVTSSGEPQPAVYLPPKTRDWNSRRRSRRVTAR